MKKLLLFYWFFVFQYFANAQMQIWTVAIGGPPLEYGYSIIQVKDGGYVVGGSYYSMLPQYNNMYVAKLDSLGDLLWANIIGGPGAFRNPKSSYGNSVTEAHDGGYVLVGGTNQYGAGGADVYIVKVDSAGNLLWTKTIGGTGSDNGYSVVQTKNHGYAITGSTSSFGAGNSDVYVILLDSIGNLEWTRTIGGIGDDQGLSIVQTKDKGYAITGYTDSYGAGNYDVYIVKLDSLGNLQWTRTVGGVNDDEGYSIIQTKDNGYAITGVTYSFYDTNDGDAYIIKLDSTGNLQWTKTIGGTLFDSLPPIAENSGQSIIQTTNGDYVVAGSTSSFGGGYYDDVYFVRLDSLGNVKQTHTYGGTQGEYGESIIQTKNGGFAIAGYTSNYRPSYEDVLIMLLDSIGNNCDTTGSGGIVNIGGILSSGGIITSTDSGRVDTGGSATIHGMLAGACGIITSLPNVKSNADDFEIYPNPCSNILNIDFETQLNLSSIQIMDITGRILFTDNCQLITDHYSINVSALSPGMYFLRINSGTGTEMKKFIKE